MAATTAEDGFQDPQLFDEDEAVFPELSGIPGWDRAWELPADLDRTILVDAHRGDCTTGWSETFAGSP